MSRVTFKARSGDEAYLSGRERAYASGVCHNLVVGILGREIDDYKAEIAQLFPPTHYVRSVNYDAAWKRSASLRTWFHVGDETLSLPDGRAFNPFNLALNTALTVGNNAVRLLARLHGQCEVHGWIAARDRAWLASIIEGGREAGIFRGGEGWENVCAFLTGSAKGEVVTSYSVTDSFPNPDLCGFEYNEESDVDPWEQMATLDPNEAWNRSMDAIQDAGRQWRPEDWSTIRFDDGVNAFDVARAVREIAVVPP